MDLKDTVALMNSDDYKDRFKAEYWQLRHRLDRLNDMIARNDKSELDFIPDTPILWLEQQAHAMRAYLDALSVSRLAGFLDGADNQILCDVLFPRQHDDGV